jgi:hypothetical protein
LKIAEVTNGPKSKSNIDNLIIKELSSSEGISYLELKRRIEKSFKRILSHRTFNYHIKKMLNNRVLSKYDTGQRGKQVFYSLTKYARKKIQLNILGNDHEQISLREIYANILFRIMTVGESY